MLSLLLFAPVVALPQGEAGRFLPAVCLIGDQRPSQIQRRLDEFAHLRVLQTFPGILWQKPSAVRLFYYQWIQLLHRQWSHPQPMSSWQNALADAPGANTASPLGMAFI